MRSIDLRSSLFAIVLALAVTAVLVSYSTSVEAAEGVPAGTGDHAAVPPPQVDDDMDGESELPWLFAVFFITWAAFFGYVFVMSRRQREMRREIDALRRALDQREADEAKPGEGDRG